MSGPGITYPPSAGGGGGGGTGGVTLRRVTFATGPSLALALAEDPNALDAALVQESSVALARGERWLAWSANVRVAFAPSGGPDFVLDVAALGPSPSVANYESQHDVTGGDFAPPAAVLLPGYFAGPVNVTLFFTGDPSALTDGWMDVYLATVTT